ncbi:unnamed protein product [Phaeothamnion confervicola]
MRRHLLLEPASRLGNALAYFPLAFLSRLFLISLSRACEGLVLFSALNAAACCCCFCRDTSGICWEKAASGGSLSACAIAQTLEAQLTAGRGCAGGGGSLKAQLAASRFLGTPVIVSVFDGNKRRFGGPKGSRPAHTS